MRRVPKDLIRLDLTVCLFIFFTLKKIRKTDFLSFNNVYYKPNKLGCVNFVYYR